MARPFSLEKVETRDQIQKQYERCLDQLWSAAKHLDIIVNSYGPGYEKYQQLSTGLRDLVIEAAKMVEDAKAAS